MITAQRAGAIGLFFAQIVSALFSKPFYGRILLEQCEKIGVQSLPIVLLTSFFTGGVLALQTFYGFGNMAVASTQLGSVVALSMVRELGPVLGALMVAGRVGAAVAAELGTMRVTEQVDALVTLATDPVKYLVVPRVLACALMMPLLAVIAAVVGIGGGYVVATDVIGLSHFAYSDPAFNAISNPDIVLALLKGLVFGILIGVMGCFHGYYTKGGAEGVGRATTVAVVYGSVAILISDYFITAWFS